MTDAIALEAGPARVVWDPDALAALGAGGNAAPWRIEGDLDRSATEAVRLISGSLEDGTLIAVAAHRPPGAAGHDAEVVAGLTVTPEGETRRLQEVLISTELGPDGSPRRLGLELYEEEAGFPLRVAADGPPDDMEIRLDGRRGRGRYDVVTGG